MPIKNKKNYKINKEDQYLLINKKNCQFNNKIV